MYYFCLFPSAFFFFITVIGQSIASWFYFFLSVLALLLLLFFLIVFSACGLSLQSCLTRCVPMDRSLPDSSVHGILQARMLEWVAIPFSMF